MYYLAETYGLFILEVVLKYRVTKNKEDTKTSDKTQFTYPLAYLYLHFLKKRAHSKNEFWSYCLNHTKRVYPFDSYCKTDFETVFRGLIFWRLLFSPPIAPNNNTHQQ